MLVPVFTLKLNQKVFPRLVTVGSYDGKYPCLTGATNGGKVFLHSPHRRMGDTASSKVTIESDVTLLSFGQHITAMTAGNLNPALGYDILVIGSQNNLLAYDVEKNKELFYKDLPDGANAVLIGHVANESEPLAIVGGNCAIHGFDHEGEDKYWTVTGDNVCSLALVDFNMDGQNELLVGSEDYEIRIFQHDELLTELSEADPVICLCSLCENKFAYALINGIVGVYGGDKRFFRVKSKSQPMCMHAYDMTGDGIPDLATGWSSGKLDIRSIQTGNIIYKDSYTSHIAGLMQADYRQSGKEEMICCSVDGEVRGYLPPSLMESNLTAVAGQQLDEFRALEELQKKKHELTMELKNFEISEQMTVSDGANLQEDTMGMIPAGTLLKTEFTACPAKETGGQKNLAHIELSIETNNNTILRAAVIFAESLFEGESHIVHPIASKTCNTIKVPLYHEKDAPLDLNIKAYVGQPTCAQFHVFEATRPLPRFSLYTPCGLNAAPEPEGSVVFNLHERLERVLSWMNESFLYTPAEGSATSSKLHLAYMSLRTNTPLIISMVPAEDGMTVIKTDDMDLAGDLIQSLASFLSIEDLAVVANFPHQMEDLKNILKQVDELRKVRQRLTAEMADNSGVIGNLIVRAEDARMMHHIGNMRKAYAQLYDMNKDIMTGYKIRSNNHMQLLDCLKTVNQAIQKAGKLRVGKAKVRVINACRSAIRDNDVDALIRAMKNGTA